MKAMEKGKWERPKVSINHESIFNLMKKNKSTVHLRIPQSHNNKKMIDFINFVKKNSIKKPKK